MNCDFNIGSVSERGRGEVKGGAGRGPLRSVLGRRLIKDLSAEGLGRARQRHVAAI